MSEFVIKIEDEIVQAIGKPAIERYLQMLLAQTILKAAATDILTNSEAENISEDEQWIKARKNAFINDSYSQYIRVYANI